MEIAQNTARLIEDYVSEAQIIMGSGYPYYVLGLKDHKIPEFERFFYYLFNKTKALSNNNFACPVCLAKNMPISIRRFCETCEAP